MRSTDSPPRLADSVKVVSRFQRSVRIDTDLDHPSALDGFLCTKSYERALQTLAQHIHGTKQGAFTWTGPYGGGKSSLVLSLAALIGPRGKRRQTAEAAVGQQTVEAIHAAFRPGHKGWQTIAVVGARTPAHVLVWEALKLARLVPAKQANQRTPGPREVVHAVSRLSQRDAHAGLLLVIDELGKVLEGAAGTGGDLHFLQELAEFASRSNGKLVILGVLHQAFEEYSNRLGKEARDEWAKVQGRFIDIPLSVTGNEQLELLAQAIHSRGIPSSQGGIAAVTAASIKKYRPDSPAPATDLLKRCWPLHPVTACLLGPISRRRFGQNQRSLFAFLSSHEPFGFAEFLEQKDASAQYGPEQLFDYLQVNLEPAILASPDGHRWSMALDSLERAEKRGAGALETGLLKSITLLDLFRERSGLFASQEVLHSLWQGVTKKLIDAALDRLKGWSVIAFREHLNAYAIYAGSDFDLQAALENAKTRTAATDLRAVRQLASLRPVVAKRHYHDTSTLRWFEVDLVTSVEVHERMRGFVAGGAIGQFLLIVPSQGENDRAAQALAQSVSGQSNYPCLLGVSNAGSRIMELAKELVELDYIRNNHPELRDDAVARREVDARAAISAHLLEAEVRTAFADAKWFKAGKRINADSYSDLSRLASDLADEAYCQAPRVRNELLNRKSPSPNAIAAQKTLLKAMVLQGDLPRLGFEGYPPERGLYESVLRSTGLHLDDGQRASFAEPAKRDASRLRPLWEATDKFLESAARGPISAADVLEMWRAPPFGVREGLCPVLFVAYLKSRTERYTVYLDGRLEVELSDLTIDRFTLNPANLALRVFDPSERERSLFEGMRVTATRLAPEGTSTELSDTTSLARALVGIVRSQPTFAQRTSRVSSQAAVIRSAVRAATDPNVLLHESLPKALDTIIGRPLAPVPECIRVLGDALEEIATTYQRMLTQVDQVLRTELGVNQGDLGDHELHERAQRVTGLTGDLRLEAFIARMLTYRAQTPIIEGIASLAANKPARDWSDNDADAALLSVAELAQQFNRAEAFARVKGRVDGRHAIAFVVGLDRSPAVLSHEFEISERDRKQALELVRGIKQLASKGDIRSEIVLAALAQVGSDVLMNVRSAETRAVNE